MLMNSIEYPSDSFAISQNQYPFEIYHQGISTPEIMLPQTPNEPDSSGYSYTELFSPPPHMTFQQHHHQHFNDQPQNVQSQNPSPLQHAASIIQSESMGQEPRPYTSIGLQTPLYVPPTHPFPMKQSPYTNVQLVAKTQIHQVQHQQIEGYQWLNNSSPNMLKANEPNHVAKTIQPMLSTTTLNQNRHNSFQSHSLLDIGNSTNLDDDFSSYFPRISTDLAIEDRRQFGLTSAPNSYYFNQQESNPKVIMERHSYESSNHKENETSEKGLKSPLASKIPAKGLSEKSKYRSLSANRVEKRTPPKFKRKAISVPNITRPGAHTTQPGPIPASEPKIDIDPETGDELISFSYSKQKIIRNFLIRFPVELIDVEDIPEEFLTENCVYPRAMVPPEEYKGNRGKYERECNEIGWKLSWYNPEIRNHRGLIQRAVDSWRNTRKDKNLRSRRVRKNDQGAPVF